MMMAPLLASGHGVEFLLARLELLPGTVRVEVTADCEANLMLPDREAARAAMARLFVIERGDDAAAEVWTTLAPLRFEERSQLDATAPLPPDPMWAGREHDLLTGVWEWQPPSGERFQLAVPKGEPMDTLLWRAATAGDPVKWKMLISGDRTEWLEPLPEERAWWVAALGWGGLVLVAALALVWVRRRRWRR